MQNEGEPIDRGGRKYDLPDDIQEDIESVDEVVFWNQENLSGQFSHDHAFGMKMWSGLTEIIKQCDTQPHEVRTFDNLSEAMVRASKKPDEAARLLLGLRKFLSKDIRVPLSLLTARSILYSAYAFEARAMEERGEDPRKRTPFTSHIDPSILQKLENFAQKSHENKVRQGTKILEKLMSDDPALKKKLEDDGQSDKTPDD